MEQILIVEDEKDIRETLQDILELGGYSVLTAKNGREGYDAIVNQCPDLVLCDVNMPELNGFELLTALKEHLKDETLLPFIFLTARMEKEDFSLGMSLGADDYILKPFDHHDILNTVREHLMRS
jgi:DNA-binding response OmpR family regulator